ARLFVLDLDQDRRRDLVRSGNELVVGLDLMKNTGVARDALGAEHLLDLHEHRVTVLEDAGRAIPELHASPLLLVNDTRTEAIADRLVVRQAQHFASLDGLHRSASMGCACFFPPAAGWAAGAGSADSAGDSPYARASASAGWIASRSFSLRMRSPAS